jgi:hypothetical protein
MELNINRQRRRLILECIVEYPSDLKVEQLAGIMRDFLHLNRFVVIPAEVSIYPEQTKVIQQCISLASNLKDIKQ